jgi:Protein of unknown function (DUF732)
VATIREATLVGIGIVVAPFLSAAFASAAPADDQAFLAALDKQAIAYSSPQWAINTAKYVCTLLDDGASGVNVSSEISNTSGIPIEKAGYFAGASIAAYCPQHANAFQIQPG